MEKTGLGEGGRWSSTSARAAGDEGVILERAQVGNRSGQGAGPVGAGAEQVSAGGEEPVGKATAEMSSDLKHKRRLNQGRPLGGPVFTNAPNSQRKGELCSLARDSLVETRSGMPGSLGVVGSTLEKRTIRHVVPVKTERGHVCLSAPGPFLGGGWSHAVCSLWVSVASNPCS